MLTNVSRRVQYKVPAEQQEASNCDPVPEFKPSFGSPTSVVQGDDEVPSPPSTIQSDAGIIIAMVNQIILCCLMWSD